MDAEFDLKVDKLLLTGLRKRWWCVGPSSMFQKEPVAFTRLGDKLVGWRDDNRKLHIIEDRCPHRAVPLSMGHVANNQLACRYHGVRVAGNGMVTDVPGQPDCVMIGKKLVKSYPVIEHFQGVFVYFGDEANPEPCPLDLPWELTSPDYTGLIVSTTWHTNYQYVLDNLVDIMHTRFLHEQSYSMGIDELVDVVDAKSVPDGIVITRKNDPSNVEQMHFVDSGFIYSRVGISLPPMLGPGGILRVIATIVPIDANTSQMNFWRLRTISGWQAAMYRFMYGMVYDKFTWEVMEQDREVLEALPPWPAPENLYQHDVGVTRMRRYLRKEAEKQVETLAALGKQERTGALAGAASRH